MSVAETVGRIERDLADVLGIGLAAADPGQAQEISRQLREIGLEGPAREAERLAGLLGPAGAAVDQLESYAKLRQMLDTVRLRLLRPEPLPDVPAVELPALPSMRIEAAVLDAHTRRSLLHVPDLDDLAGRFVYIERVQRFLQALPIPPEGEGVVVWADLSLGEVLAGRLAAHPPVAFECARRAADFQNFVVRRNAIRVLERLLVPRAPVPDQDPAMQVLLRMMYGDWPLLMHEAQAAWRRAKGLPPVDLREPYFGLLDGRTDTALGRRAARVRPLPGPPKVPSLLQRLVGAPQAPAQEPQPSAWFERSDEFNTEDLKELTGPRGDVLQRLGRTVREASNQEDRLRVLQRIMFLQDPLAIPVVRQVFAQDAAADVRQKALLALAYLGDDGILPTCRRALQGRSNLNRHAALALGVLADIRGFRLLWSAFVRNVHPDAVAHAFQIHMEAAAPLLPKLAHTPKLLSRKSTMDALQFIHEGRLPDVLLYIADLAPDAKTRRTLFQQFTPQKVPKELRPVIEATQARLAQRVATPSEPMERRREAVQHMRTVAGDQAEAVLAPVLSRLSPEDRAAVLAPPEPKRRGKKKEVARAA